MKKVLVVEDYEDIQELYRIELAGKAYGKVDMISAFSIQEAKEHFACHPDVDLIVMDACLVGLKPNTLPLVKEMRKTFTGPMIAASASPEYRQQLVEAGCDYEAPKGDVPKKVIEILKL